MRVQEILKPFDRAAGQPARAVLAPAPQGAERRSEPRWLAEGVVRLYLFNSRDQLIEASADLMDQSLSGARIRTTHKIRSGDRFIIVDRDGFEGEAQAAWVDELDDCTIVGTRITWVGRVLTADVDAKAAVN